MKIPKFLLPHTAIVKPFVSNGAYGPVYGDEVTYKCRIEEKNTLVKDSEGKEVVSNTRGFFEYKGEDVPSQSKVIWNGKEHIVIDSVPQTGLKEVSHIEVMM